MKRKCSGSFLELYQKAPPVSKLGKFQLAFYPHPVSLSQRERDVQNHPSPSGRRDGDEGSLRLGKFQTLHFSTINFGKVPKFSIPLYLSSNQKLKLKNQKLIISDTN
jgi:hypothetical protein